MVKIKLNYILCKMLIMAVVINKNMKKLIIVKIFLLLSSNKKLMIK